LFYCLLLGLYRFLFPPCATLTVILYLILFSFSFALLLFLK
jgi:hypothetical protein